MKRLILAGLTVLGALGAISVHAYTPPLSVSAGPCCG